MGLDKYKSEGSNRGGTRNTGKQKSSTSDGNDEQPFKIVQGDRGREKVFQTEEDWEETVEFVEGHMELSIGEVMNKSAGERFQILHSAILRQAGTEQLRFHPHKVCIVCDREFQFPKNWNFTRFKGEVACNDHKISDVVEAHSSVNSIKG